MPKVIKNLKDNIISTSKEELFNKGFKELNMRNIAKKNNTAVGTIYNYFKNKEMLVASIILEDWLKAVEKIKYVANNTSSVSEGLEGILNAIKSFYDLYSDVFRNSGLPNVKVAYKDKYEMLLSGVKEEIKILLDRFDVSYDEFQITFIVSNIFSSVTNDWPFEQTINLLQKVIKE